MLEFEWDNAKAELNVNDHGVSFDEAASAFADLLSRTIYDPDHSETEHRFLLLGMSPLQRLLVITHTERGDKIRIISARIAERRERAQYETGD